MVQLKFKVARLTLNMRLEPRLTRTVEFIGEEYFRGSFYETVLQAVDRLLF